MIEGKERRGERAARSLGSRFPRLRSIPPPSLASLFPSSPPSARTPRTPNLASSFLFSGSRMLFFRSLSLSFSSLSLLASTRAQTVLSIHPIRLLFSSAFLSLFLCRLAFLHVQQDVAAISERGRIYIYARINHRGRRSRRGKKRENGLHVNAASSSSSSVGCRRSLSAISSSSFQREDGRENFTHRPRSRRGNVLPNPENVRRYAPSGTFRNERTR